MHFGFQMPILLTVIGLSLSVSATENPEPVPVAVRPAVRIMMQWLPQAQFAGYYMAVEKGFYRERGVDVEIVHAGPTVSAAQALRDGKTEFVTLFLASAIRERASGLPLVQLAQFSHRSALLFIARKSDGISTPSAISGKKVGLWQSDFRSIPLAFFRKHGVEAQLVPQGSGVNLFLSGAVDITIAMWYNEYHSILNAGFEPDELQTFFFSDFGFDVPEDGLYCIEPLRRSNPDLCAAVTAASVAGWEYAFRNPDEAIKTVLALMRKHRVPANSAHQRWMLERMMDVTGFRQGGRCQTQLPEEAYRSCVEILSSEGMIDKIPPYLEFRQPVESP
jgi:NitT/TauT family transport system substrate-binding protein